MAGWGALEAAIRKRIAQESAELAVERAELAALGRGEELLGFDPDEVELEAARVDEEAMELRARLVADRRVLTRVVALAREDRWGPNRMARPPPPPAVRKGHRQHLLEEMRWLAEDFARERRFKMDTARRLAQRIAKEQDGDKRADASDAHGSRTEAAAARDSREARRREQDLMRVAARISRDVRKFWDQIEVVVQHKLREAEDKEQKVALNQHLDELV
ncbi:MAG TPA: hypothetical protein VJB16_04990, partial [archaeon]|nr:hypothetical protein [archaeon]